MSASRVLKARGCAHVRLKTPRGPMVPNMFNLNGLKPSGFQHARLRGLDPCGQPEDGCISYTVDFRVPLSLWLQRDRDGNVRTSACPTQLLSRLPSQDCLKATKRGNLRTAAASPALRIIELERIALFVSCFMVHQIVHPI